MMFELSITCKYLIPRWRQLSVSIISTISILIIALVVWLVLVFLSVTTGIEQNWLNKLIALNGSIQVKPTENYYKSYYYLIDSISDSSEYKTKNLDEKLSSEQTNPYNPEFDISIPSSWPKPHLDSHGQLVDPVKMLMQSINKIDNKNLYTSIYEYAFVQMRLRFLRDHDNHLQAHQSFFKTTRLLFSYQFFRQL